MQAPAPDSTSDKELGMVCMKMLSLALLASAKGVSPTCEKHPMRIWRA
jgi:hypothetical protein